MHHSLLSRSQRLGLGLFAIALMLLNSACFMAWFVLSFFVVVSFLSTLPASMHSPLWLPSVFAILGGWVAWAALFYLLKQFWDNKRCHLPIWVIAGLVMGFCLDVGIVFNALWSAMSTQQVTLLLVVWYSCMLSPTVLAATCLVLNRKKDWTGSPKA